MGYYKPNPFQKFYKINYQISAPVVRLIDEEAKQIGVLSIAEARKYQADTGLDLVEIAPNATPPVVKLIEFSKFKYQEAKKLKAEKKGIKGGELKEIQMTPFIGEADYDTRLKKAQKFSTSGNKIKLSVKFQGRQITHQEFGYKLIDKFKNDLKDFATPEGEAKLLGKRLFQTFTPIKNKPIKNEDPKQKIQN